MLLQKGITANYLLIMMSQTFSVPEFAANPGEFERPDVAYRRKGSKKTARMTLILRIARSVELPLKSALKRLRSTEVIERSQ